MALSALSVVYNSLSWTIPSGWFEDCIPYPTWGMWPYLFYASLHHILKAESHGGYPSNMTLPIFTIIEGYDITTAW